MRSQPQKNSSKKLIIWIIIVIVAIGCGATYYTIENSREPTENSSKTDSNPVTSSNDEPAKEPTTDNKEQSSSNIPTTVENKTPIQYEGESPDDEQSIDDERFRIPDNTGDS